MRPIRRLRESTARSTPGSKTREDGALPTGEPTRGLSSGRCMAWRRVSRSTALSSAKKASSLLRAAGLSWPLRAWTSLNTASRCWARASGGATLAATTSSKVRTSSDGAVLQTWAWRSSA